MFESDVDYPLTDSLTAKGFVCYDKQAGPRPLVMIASDWRGRSDFYCDIARKIGNLGFVGFAVDMYGDAKLGVQDEDKKVLHEPLKQNRDELLRRIMAALDFMIAQPFVNTSKIAAIGYCFGGMCVLDLARANADVKGVVSLHGLLAPPPKEKFPAIKTKILVLHGYDDIYVKPPQVLEFSEEMTRKNADWQIHMYGNTSHSFTKPGANDPVAGLKYDAVANRRSWDATQYFLKEIFTDQP